MSEGLYGQPRLAFPPVRVARAMCVLERTDDQSILLVVHKIPPQVIKHDRVVLIVELREFAPQEGQRLAVKHACNYQMPPH